MHFSTRGRKGGGGNDVRFYRDNEIEYDCVFDVYLKTISVFKDILQRFMSRKIQSNGQLRTNK